jgi:hypothetical protein
MNETATAGGVACISTVGSGIALDQSANVATYKAAPSGCVPLGILVNDVVNIDQSKYHINFQKDEVQLGGKVTLVSDGWLVTNMIYPGTTPTAGQTAYLQHSGYITPTSAGAAATPAIGQFRSTKDEDGYAKVYVKLPNF